MIVPINRYIKVNFVDYNGNRTSTTISTQIALFWGRYHGYFPSIQDKEFSQAIQKQVNAYSVRNNLDKEIIEGLLLRDTEQKIIEQATNQNNLEQPSSF